MKYTHSVPKVRTGPQFSCLLSFQESDLQTFSYLILTAMVILSRASCLAKLEHPLIIARFAFASKPNRSIKFSHQL
jgi:hypothetical protein